MQSTKLANRWNRREALLAGFATCAASTLPVRLASAANHVSSKHFGVQEIKRTTVKLPYRPVPQRAMSRELPHWRWSEICEVTLTSGQVGLGETLLYYTWGATGDDDVQRAQGGNAIGLMWDDSLGAGLQSALMDAVAKTASVPIHALFGEKVNARTPLSWWNIDTSAEDMASDCKAALDLGYMSYKTKGRPWFDIHQQLDRSSAVVPDAFKIDMDFNDTLLTAEQGMQIIKDLEKYPQVDIYETPIPQSDVEGNQRICEATRVNVAMHFGSPEPEVAVREQCCDGFVVGGGASRVMRAGNFCGHANKPFWLQLVGTGITAAYSLHFGGVLSHATWPAVNCHQLYQHDLLAEPIVVEGGTAEVPDKVGLGYELDRDAVARFRVDKPKQRPEPPRLIKTTWDSGKVMYTANDGTVNFMLRAGNEGKYGYYEKGAHTELVPNDGSAKWKRLYEKARNQGPFRA